MSVSRPLEEQIEEIANVRVQMEKGLREESKVYAEQVRLMREVYGPGQQKGGLDQIHRIMIAVGMAVLAGSESAVEWTITRALNHGATEQMIRDAVDVALLNGGTFAVSNARFAYEALRVRQLRASGSKPFEEQVAGER